LKSFGVKIWNKFYRWVNLGDASDMGDASNKGSVDNNRKIDFTFSNLEHHNRRQENS
jgi:hypothetical protein